MAFLLNEVFENGNQKLWNMNMNIYHTHSRNGKTKLMDMDMNVTDEMNELIS